MYTETHGQQQEERRPDWLNWRHHGQCDNAKWSSFDAANGADSDAGAAAAAAMRIAPAALSGERCGSMRARACCCASRLRRSAERDVRRPAVLCRFADVRQWRADVVPVLRTVQNKTPVRSINYVE